MTGKLSSGGHDPGATRRLGLVAVPGAGRLRPAILRRAPPFPLVTVALARKPALECLSWWCSLRQADVRRYSTRS